MKHRSPLVTLAAVAVAFAIMFIVNMVVGPPGNSSTGTAGPSEAQATVSASSASSQPTETAVSFAVAVLGGQAAAYFCDGRAVESWFRGMVEGEDISLKSRSGATLQARLDGDHVKGAVEIKNESAAPQLNPESPQVTVDGENLNATPVNGTEDL